MFIRNVCIKRHVYVMLVRNVSLKTLELNGIFYILVFLAYQPVIYWTIIS